LAFVKELQLPKPPANIHPNRVRQSANRCRRYKAQPLAKLDDPLHRYAYLVAYLFELQGELTDQLLDMFDRWHGDLLRRGRNAQKHHLYKHVTALNRALNTLTEAVSAFLEARKQGQDPVEAMLAVVDEVDLTATVASAKATMRPADMDYRDLLERRYTLRRKALLRMYRDLSFEAVDGNHPALEALDYVVKLQDEFNKRVQAVEQVVKQQMMQAPLEHLKWTRWKRHALAGNTINPNYYEWVPGSA
jgi:23S rRNA maturation mini-RNase III